MNKKGGVLLYLVVLVLGIIIGMYFGVKIGGWFSWLWSIVPIK